jgi:hypothetical protein
MTEGGKNSNEECRKGGKEAWKILLPAFLPSSFFVSQTDQRGMDFRGEIPDRFGQWGNCNGEAAAVVLTNWTVFVLLKPSVLVTVTFT